MSCVVAWADVFGGKDERVISVGVSKSELMITITNAIVEDSSCSLGSVRSVHIKSSVFMSIAVRSLQASW